MRKTLPYHTNDFSQVVRDRFEDFLKENGAEIIDCSKNPYEILRVHVGPRLSILYKNGAGVLRWTADLQEAWECYVDKKPWCAVDRNRSMSSAKRRVIYDKLRDRDGPDCFYCGLEMLIGTESIEHFVPLSKGGTHHEDNLALACKPCNGTVGNMCVVQKILLRDKLRAENAQKIAAQLLSRQMARYGLSNGKGH